MCVDLVHSKFVGRGEPVAPLSPHTQRREVGYNGSHAMIFDEALDGLHRIAEQQLHTCDIGDACRPKGAGWLVALQVTNMTLSKKIDYLERKLDTILQALDRDFDKDAV